MQPGARPFNSLYRHGFARVAVCVPRLKVAAPKFNADQTLVLARQAAGDGAALAMFPEMGISAYSNEDLFHQDALLDATEAAVARVAKETADLHSIIVIGAPLRFESRLFDCAIVLHRGKALGVIPKMYLPY